MTENKIFLVTYAELVGKQKERRMKNMVELYSQEVELLKDQLNFDLEECYIKYEKRDLARNLLKKLESI